MLNFSRDEKYNKWKENSSENLNKFEIAKKKKKKSMNLKID